MNEMLEKKHREEEQVLQGCVVAGGAEGKDGGRHLVLYLCEVRPRVWEREMKTEKYSVVRRAGHKGSVAERVEVGSSRVAVRRRMVLVWG